MRAFLLALLLTTPAQAEPPKQWPAGPLRNYFEQLQRPDNNKRSHTDGDRAVVLAMLSRRGSGWKPVTINIPTTYGMHGYTVNGQRFHPKQ
jgi:hypothetical protein